MLCAEDSAMAYRFDHLDFVIQVEAEPSGHGHWLIHAIVRYADRLGAAAIERVAPEARFELMRGILQEDRRIRRLGATNVHVLVEGDGETARFFEILGRGVAPARHDGPALHPEM
jgi:GNAT superfamily N-acetyltransferase